MQQKHLFEYAVIRIVPKVEREEFINAGVILYCYGQHFLQTRYCIDEERLKMIDKESDSEELLQNLIAIEHICNGADGSGPIGRLDIAARFRWLTATRSTIIQPSKVHPGFCSNALETLNRLYAQLVYTR